MKITHRIERKVATIDQHRTVLDAALLMKDLYIGSVVVTCETGICGLFTERDLLMRVVGERRDPAATKLMQVLSKDQPRVSPDDTAEHCLDLMKEYRCRHLLVFEGDEFVGIVSLRDMVVLLLDEKEQLIARLKEYITG